MVHTLMHAVFFIQTSLFDNIGIVTVLWNICLYQEARYECKLSCESIPSEGKLICPRPQILLRQMLDLEFLPVLSIWIYTQCHILVYDVQAINTIMPY